MMKILKNRALIFVMMLVLSASFLGMGSSVSEASSAKNVDVKDLKIESVDGVKYSPQKHKNIAGVFVVVSKHGKKVLGFTTKEKFNAFVDREQRRSVKPEDVHVTADATSFFEHADFEGAAFGLLPGDWQPNVGSFNDQISSLRVAPLSWVKLYEHDNYGGAFYGIGNIDPSYLNIWNIGLYAGEFWNDRITSIQTGRY